MIVFARAFILVACAILYFLLIIQYFVTVQSYASSYIHGSNRDSGNFPVRKFNVNAFYEPIFTGTNDAATVASYPLSNPLNGNQHSRLIIANTTQCPLFRYADDNSTVIIT